MARNKNNELEGALTAPLVSDYNDSEIAGEIVAPEKDNSSKRKNAYLAMKQKLQAGMATGSLPMFESDPDWAFAWVPDDPRMSGDNLMIRLNQGWELVTEEDQPKLAAALSLSKDMLSTGTSSVKALRYKEMVAVKLAREAQRAWLDYHHSDLPEQKNRELLAAVENNLDAKAGRIEGKVQMNSGISKEFTRVKADY